MSTDPSERLAALRREVEAETPARSTQPPPVPAPSSPAATTPTPPPGTQGDATPTPGAVSPATAAPPMAPVTTPVAAPTTGSAVPLRSPAQTRAPIPPPVTVDRGASISSASPTDEADGRPAWDIESILADTSLTTWVSLGLVVLGGYMVLSWFVPGIDVVGSLLILVVGVVLLAQHLQRGAGSWALYAGALLTGAGAGRLVGDILPGAWSGLTTIGVGVAFLAIGYLRHSQAGGYGWQGILGGAVLALGVVQLVLGWLPGSPGIMDLILPALFILGGLMLLGHARRTNASRRT